MLLAGDSAHVNNPIGGMGLNGGIQDAVNLSQKLARVVLGGEPDTLLDLYDLQRRTVAVEFVQEQSIANKKRLEASDPETRKQNLDELRAMAADPQRARQFLLRTAMIASQKRADSLELADAARRRRRASTKFARQAFARGALGCANVCRRLARICCRASHCASRETAPTPRLRQASGSPLQARALRHGLKRQVRQNLNSVQ